MIRVKKLMELFWEIIFTLKPALLREAADYADFTLDINGSNGS